MGAPECPSAANVGAQIRVHCLLQERLTRAEEFRENLARLIRYSPAAIDVRDADSHTAHSSAETAHGKMQAPLDVRLQGLRQIRIQNANICVHLVPP